jgi:deoxyribodipyrimidine photo-lyase
MKEITIVWFRRDLRLHDQAALYHALQASPHPVLILFVFDTNILNDLVDKDDKRVTFIYQTLEELRMTLQRHNSDLLIRYGEPIQVWSELTESYKIAQVYFNRDYEPYAKKRDEAVVRFLEGKGVRVFNFKDHLIFESGEVARDDGNPYVVFTPFKKRWLQKLEVESMQNRDGKLAICRTEEFFGKLMPVRFDNIPSLESMGFIRSQVVFPGREVNPGLLRNYDKTRDFPGREGTSRLGIHLRFGTISIRKLVNEARDLNPVFLSELIWREFYSHILDRYPRVCGESFKTQYDRIAWINDQQHFHRWCEGMTGYPIVDAGMRQLNQTGYMHNRVRMITASFLTRHLLTDWRWGEAYFALKLLDYELASNNGGWQWAAGCGTDAVPYFRIFNPEIQQKKFDPDLEYVRKWVPEVHQSHYPKPVVEHRFARERSLRIYKNALT